MAFIKEFENLEDDGLITPEIGSWGKQKYRLVTQYSQLFSKSMKNKWDSIVYIDLFSGAGRSKIRKTNRIIASSPILALKNEHKFDRYIFCEEDPEKYNALKCRIEREFSQIDTQVVLGDSNECIDDFLGNSHWREAWENLSYPNKTFEEFIVDQFNKSMSGLRYINPGIENCCSIRSDDKNLLLYRLTLYSRNQLGKKFWKETKKYTNPQRQLFE
jgi:hypothetical protein